MKDNKVGDALSRRLHLLATSSTHVTGFESIKEQYQDDQDFGAICQSLMQTPLDLTPISSFEKKILASTRQRL